MLNMTKVAHELTSDADMYLFFEIGMRDGVSYISKQYSKASNNYLKQHVLKQESEHIIYLNENNLSSYAISKFPPTRGFKWIDFKNFDSNKYNSNSSKGHVLENDFKLPKELRELHNDYSLVQHKIEITKEMLSSYQLKIVYFYNISIVTVNKLVPNFLIKDSMCFIMKTCNFI